jgi:siroheme synthase-like protein
MSNKDSTDQNNLFPVFLKLESLNTLVVGGGNVALEKLTAIFQNSPKANVRLVAKAISPNVRSLIEDKKIAFTERSFQPDDLIDIDLVIIAINDKKASKEIHEACKKKKILANVADTPEYCDFYLASIMQKGNLKIAVSTNGKSPTIAKRVRDVLAETFPDEIDEVLDHMENIRNELKGNFSEKVKALNKVTASLAKQEKPKVLNK